MYVYCSKAEVMHKDGMCLEVNRTVWNTFRLCHL